MKPIIKVSNLSKQYEIGKHQNPNSTLRETLVDMVRAPLRGLRRHRKESVPAIWALKDVAFDVRCGEVIGVIGRNGAGKSTLLKILSRITEPTAGYADIRGRVGSLLEVGTGFHPELTGRENIYLNGAILGMPRTEIENKFDEIVAFAEVERFIDTAVKHYSSGMYLRLAFAVAAHLQPDVLLVDEVLAVGDAAFQRKCLGRMNDVAQQGRTVLLVSHDMTAVAHLAARCLWLEAGSVARFGETESVVRDYLQRPRELATDLASRNDRQGDGMIRLLAIRFLNSEGVSVNAVGSGDPVTIAVTYQARVPDIDPRDVWLDMTFRDALGHPVATLSTRFSPVEITTSATTDAVTLQCHVPSLTVADETYSLDLWLAYRQGLADHVLRAAELLVTPSNYFGTGHSPVKRKHGAGLIQHTWTARGVGDREAVGPAR